jgi:hypothetical protein
VAAPAAYSSPNRNTSFFLPSPDHLGAFLFLGSYQI